MTATLYQILSQPDCNSRTTGHCDITSRKYRQIISRRL